MSTGLRYCCQLICCLLTCVVGCDAPSAAPAAAAKPPVPATAAKKPAAGEVPQPAPAKLDKVATALRFTPIFQYAVRSVAFHPDGKTLAIGTGDGVIRLWDLEKQDFAWIMNAHDNWVFDLAYTPDGRLVSGGGDNRVKLIDNSTGLIKATFEDHTNDLHGVAVTPNGKWLVSGGDDTRVVARALVGDTMAELGRHEKQVTSVTVSLDNKWAASSSRDSTMKLWDLQKLELGQTVTGHMADVMTVAFSPDSSQLASGGYDRTVRLWDAATGKQLKQLGFHDDWVFSVAFSKDGQYLFTGCGDDLVRMFRLSDGELVFKADIAGDVADLAMSADGTLLAAGTSEGIIRIISVDGSKSQLLKKAVRIPRTVVAPERPQPQKVTDYLDEHRHLVEREGKWVETMAGLSSTGDAFSLFLLHKIDSKSLNAADTEVLTKVIQQIEHRRRPAGDTLRMKEISPMLFRAAVADLTCHRMEHTLKPWVIEKLQAQAAAEPAIRQYLIELREHPSVPEGEDQQTWGSVSERIQQYIDQILKSSAK